MENKETCVHNTFSLVPKSVLQTSPVRARAITKGPVCVYVFFAAPPAFRLKLV